MAREALNKIRFKQFADRCRVAQINRVTITRNNAPQHISLRYSARAQRSGKRFNGEWIVTRKEREDAQVEEAVEAFLAKVREDFMISKGAGFSDRGDEAPTAAAEEAEAQE